MKTSNLCEKNDKFSKSSLLNFSWSQLNYPLNPPARWGHSLNLFSKNILLFGGFSKNYFSDLWSFDLKKKTWSLVNGGTSPEPRSNHSAISIISKSKDVKDIPNQNKNREKLLIFGGKGKNNKIFGDLWEFEFITSKWKLIENKGNSPCPRSGHSSDLLFDKFVIIFGGESIVDLDDLWTFNLQTYQWKQQKTFGKGPCPRKFHSSSIIQENLFIIAGCCENYQVLNDIYMMDLKNFVSNEETSENNCILNWVKIQPKGSLVPRWGHSVVTYQNSIYIFGGKNSGDLHDLCVFNPLKMKLSEINQNGNIPSVRRRHSMVLIGSSILLFGGFNGKYLNDLYHLNLFHIKPNRKISFDKFSIQTQNYVTLICENQKFKCNKELLMQKSEYFKALFSSQFKEKNCYLMEVNEVNPIIFSYLLEYFENDELMSKNLSQKDYYNILKASKFFMLENFCSSIQRKLGENLCFNKELDFDNAHFIEIYDLCIRWNLSYLLEFIFFAICKNEKENLKIFLDTMKIVSPENYDRNFQKIKFLRRDLKFWINLKNN